VGVVYDRLHTREIAAYGGLVQKMKWFAFFFLLFSMGNVGLPGISGFVGEILTMAGAFQVSTWVAALAALGMILSAAYGLRLYREVVYGTITNEKVNDMPDLDRRELGLLTILGAMAVYLGFHPSPTLAVFTPATEFVQVRYVEAAQATEQGFAATLMPGDELHADDHEGGEH
ncbi:MAG: proton-conducting transporter membrane subunit, partial [Pseudomonadota bacterium]